MNSIDPAITQSIKDSEHLRLLKIFYYVSGGVTAVLSLLPLIHLTLGIILFSSGATGSNAADAHVFRVMGALMIGIASLIIVIGMSLAALKLFAARSLDRRKHRSMTIAVAAITCLAIPYGTVLGVMTIMVLSRPSIIALYEAAPMAIEP